MSSAVRKRGPHPGAGGRPKLALDKDPDRWTIVAILWLDVSLNNPKASAVLLAVDGILSPFDCIEVETGTSMNDGRPASFSITNTQPARALATNSPARIPHAAPGGAALRNSRLKNLREKVALYRRLGMRTKLSKKEVFWRDSCFLAFNALAAGDHAVGGLLLQTVGFDMTAASQRRFASALTADLA